MVIVLIVRNSTPQISPFLEEVEVQITGCSVIVEHQNVGKREESQIMFRRFLSFNIVSDSMDADVQSRHPFFKDGFKLIMRDPIENPHDTIQKLMFILEY
jgi:hypothetical protein